MLPALAAHPRPANPVAAAAGLAAAAALIVSLWVATSLGSGGLVAHGTTAGAHRSSAELRAVTQVTLPPLTRKDDGRKRIVIDTPRAWGRGSSKPTLGKGDT